MARDFDDASKKAREAADAAAERQLNAIKVEAEQLGQIFKDLKLTDKATYDSLTKIVQEATQRHESVASVIDRVKALGGAGVGLASKIAGLSGSGGLSAVRSALNL